MNQDKLEYALSLTTNAFTNSVKLAAGSVGKMEKDIKRSTANAGKAFSGLAKSVGAVGVAAAAVAAGGLYAFSKVMSEAVGLANEQEKVEVRLAAVLKATGNAAGYSLEQLKAMAGGLQQITTVGDEATLAGMAILATFKEIKGDNFKEATQAALDMSEVMGTDLKSSMVMLGKALNDPAKGLSALSRAGVTFTDSQKAMIKTMVEVGDVAGAQKVMLAELKTEFGGTAEAARSSFGGSVIAASNALGDLKEELGFVITKNQFFITIAEKAEAAFIKWSAAINGNSAKLMELSKTITIGLVTGMGKAVKIAAFFHTGFLKINFAVAAGVDAIAKFINIFIKGFRKVQFGLDLLMDGLVKLGVIDANPFDTIIDALTDFEDVSDGVMSKWMDDIIAAENGYKKIDDVISGMQRSLEDIPAAAIDPGTTLATTPTTATTSPQPAQPRLVKQANGEWTSIGVAAQKTISKALTEGVDAGAKNIKKSLKDVGKVVPESVAKESAAATTKKMVIPGNEKWRIQAAKDYENYQKQAKDLQQQIKTLNAQGQAGKADYLEGQLRQVVDRADVAKRKVYYESDTSRKGYIPQRKKPLVKGKPDESILDGQDMTPSDRALAKVNSRYNKLEEQRESRDACGSGAETPAKIVEIRWPTGSLKGSESSVDDFLNQLEMAGMRA